MLFENIGVIDPLDGYLKNGYVAVQGERIVYVGTERPAEDYGERYCGAGRVLMPALVNAHSHAAMTLLRGYGENMVLDDWLNKRVFPFEAQLTGEDIYNGAMLAFAEMLRFGTVSLTDMYFFGEDMARAVADSGVKCNMSIGVTEFEGRGFYDIPSYQTTMTLVNRYHGTSGGRFLADLCVHGEYTSNETVVAQVAEVARETGLRVHIHMSETRAEHEACKQRRHGETPAMYFARLGLFDQPVTAAHCTWAEPADIDLMKRYGVTAACCPVSNMKLAGGFANVRRLLDSGINIALGTDGAASNNNLNLLEEVKLFATLYKGVSGDPTLVTPQQAIHAATLGGARSQGREDCGRIAPGFRADLIVLNTDVPHMHPVHDMITNVVFSAQGSDVCLTMADGRVLYRDGEYTTIDLERVIRQAEASTARVLAALQ